MPAKPWGRGRAFKGITELINLSAPVWKFR
jgi:hypothetical protein